MPTGFDVASVRDFHGPAGEVEGAPALVTRGEVGGEQGGVGSDHDLQDTCEADS